MNNMNFYWNINSKVIDGGWTYFAFGLMRFILKTDGKTKKLFLIFFAFNYQRYLGAVYISN